jgi:hypothetical protein
VADIVVPLVEDFLLRFPEFEGMDEQKIALALLDASTYVSEEWIDAHLSQAIMALAAHFLWLEGMHSGELAAALDASGGSTSVTRTGPATMKSVGPLTIKYMSATETTTTGSAGGSASSGGLQMNLESSVYGQRFLLLASYSFPPVMVVI